MTKKQILEEMERRHLVVPKDFPWRPSPKVCNDAVEWLKEKDLYEEWYENRFYVRCYQFAWERGYKFDEYIMSVEDMFIAEEKLRMALKKFGI